MERRRVLEGLGAGAGVGAGIGEGLARDRGGGLRVGVGLLDRLNSGESRRIKLPPTLPPLWGTRAETCAGAGVELGSGSDSLGLGSSNCTPRLSRCEDCVSEKVRVRVLSFAVGLELGFDDRPLLPDPALVPLLLLLSDLSDTAAAAPAPALWPGKVLWLRPRSRSLISISAMRRDACRCT